MFSRKLISELLKKIRRLLNVKDFQIFQDFRIVEFCVEVRLPATLKRQS